MPIIGVSRRAGARRKAIHVSAGALVDGAGRVLTSRRHQGVHQGGLWEFPGGKVEPNETPLESLRRELDEELGISVVGARPLIQVHHDYVDRSIWLDVWRVDSWSGEPRGREGQAIRWTEPKRLDASDFPAADVPVIAALRLPPVYLITPEPGPDLEGFLTTLAVLVRAGVALIQLRAKTLQPHAYRALARAVVALCKAHGATLLLNAEPGLATELGAQGVHLTAERLMRCTSRPLSISRWVAASCHDRRELDHACSIGVDFLVLSPVRFTPSHPAARPLGWGRFQALVSTATVPVYALGGLGLGDLNTGWAHGSQGVAGTSTLWGGLRADSRSPPGFASL